MLDKRIICIMQCIGTITCIMFRQLCKPRHYSTLCLSQWYCLHNRPDMIQTVVPSQYVYNMLPNTLKLFAFQSFDIERTRWRLFQKWVGGTKYLVSMFLLSVPLSHFGRWCLHWMLFNINWAMSNTEKKINIFVHFWCHFKTPFQQPTTCNTMLIPSNMAVTFWFDVWSWSLWVRIRLDEVYTIHHYVIQFVNYLRQVHGILWVLQFSPPIKLTAMI